MTWDELSDLLRQFCVIFHYQTFRESTTLNQMKVDPYYLRRKTSPGTSLMLLWAVVRGHPSGALNGTSAKFGDFQHVCHYISKTMRDRATVTSQSAR